MNRILRPIAFCGLLAFSAGTLHAGDEPKKEAAPNPATASKLALGDEVVAKGKGCEVKRSQIDESFITYQANMSARGQTVPEADRERVETQLLDRLIFTQLLMAKATEQDKAKGTETVDKMIADYKAKSLSEES